MPTNTPQVSIIMATYNRAHLIGETLDICNCANLPEFGCIMVDDGSTDNTSMEPEKCLVMNGGVFHDWKMYLVLKICK